MGLALIYDVRPMFTMSLAAGAARVGAVAAFGGVCLFSGYLNPTGGMVFRGRSGGSACVAK